MFHYVNRKSVGVVDALLRLNITPRYEYKIKTRPFTLAYTFYRQHAQAQPSP
jgi:hypothetical protein